MDKAKRKFDVADANNDGRLTKDEYVYFQHPEESSKEELKEMAVDEVTEEMDKNGDRYYKKYQKHLSSHPSVCLKTISQLVWVNVFAAS